MASAELDKLKGQLVETIGKIVDEAYAAGVAAGKRETAQYISGMAATLLNPNFVAPPSLLSEVPSSNWRADYSNVKSEPGIPIPPQTRAPRGSVRPLVVSYLRSGSTGRPVDIAQKLDQNENSVRGTLNQLASEDLAIKKDDLWYATAKLLTEFGPSENENAPSEETEDASS